MAIDIRPESRPAIFKEIKTAFRVAQFFPRDLTEQHVLDFLDGHESDILGCSAIYKEQILETLTFATSKKVLHILISDHMHSLPTVEEHILRNTELVVLGLGLDTVAFSLFLDTNETRVGNFVDLYSLHGRFERGAPKVIQLILGGEELLHVNAVNAAFCVSEDDDTPAHSALRAWACCVSASYGITATKLPEWHRVSTLRLPLNDLKTIAKIHRDAVILDAKKPQTVKNDVHDEYKLNEKGDMLQVTSERFGTRLRVGEGQVVQITDDVGSVIEGVVAKVSGRSAFITLPPETVLGTIQSVHTVGKDALTYAERLKTNILLGALEGRLNLTRMKTFRSIWFPSFRNTSRLRPIPEDSITVPLNDSQKDAVKAVFREPLKGEVDIQIVIGPPGSGKTSVIGACVQAIMATETVEQQCFVWLAAQSNVAVKNIARKLVDINFTNFKLLVSNEFFFDWHEHLYHRVSKHMIHSREFPKKVDDTAELLGGAHVILCTLSMLSHPKLASFIGIVPIQMLIIDEASQIELGDFVPLLAQHAETLKKLVFVGDDRQLAPYGQEDVQNLQSVFEIDALRKRGVFLNTQYRMPIPIGQFISNNVYKGQLRSQHDITSADSCKFIDVYSGQEDRSGNSWLNMAECDAAVNVARILHNDEKDFRIITPYDAQRSTVEAALKKAKLPWAEKVFNVDSFQGNEAPYIIVTVVRTQGIGFLGNERRTNVMLSRCQAGLIIVTNKSFLESYAAKRTLVGRMAAEWGPDAWVGERRVHNGSLEPGEDDEIIDKSPKRMASLQHAHEPAPKDWGGTPTDGYVDWGTGEVVEPEDWTVSQKIEPHATSPRENDWTLPSVTSTSASASSRDISKGKADLPPVQADDVAGDRSVAVVDWTRPDGIGVGNDWSQPENAQHDWTLPDTTQSSHGRGSRGTSNADMESTWSSSTGSDNRGRRGSRGHSTGQRRARGRGRGSERQFGDGSRRGRDRNTKGLDAFS